MAININNQQERQKMIPYKDLAEKLKKDFSKDRKYQIDNFIL